MMARPGCMSRPGSRPADEPVGALRSVFAPARQRPQGPALCRVAGPSVLGALPCVLSLFVQVEVVRQKMSRQMSNKRHDKDAAALLQLINSLIRTEGNRGMAGGKKNCMS